MTGAHAVVLGLVQGITEFLPISSSAHLILTSYFLNWQDQGLVFDVAAHLGSMVAVVVYLRREIGQVFKTASSSDRDGAKEGNGPGAGAGFALLVGTLPVAVGGLLFRGFVESTAREPVLIAITSIVFGVALLVADRLGTKTRRLHEIGWRDGLLIGLGQALALIPGTSRAGITMTMALALGYDRASAARFSFLLAVPVSVLVAAGQLAALASSTHTGIAMGEFAIGFVASGVAAYLSIGFLLQWVKQQDYSLFVAYRVVLGLVILVSLWR